jgi:uncharacterized protein YdiU (UPF0061 family)
VRYAFADPSVFDEWVARWRRRLQKETRSDAERRAAMRAVNPAYIPRNHRVQEVIDAANGNEMDLRPLEDLLAVVGRPYDDHEDRAELARPPRPEEMVTKTFCGT